MPETASVCPACGQPSDEHIGPPSPPRVHGHMGETRQSGPGSCMTQTGRHGHRSRRQSYTEQAFDGHVVANWAELDYLANVLMPGHDEPRPGELAAEHYAAGVMDCMRRMQACEDDTYPWRHGVVPGGPYG